MSLRAFITRLRRGPSLRASQPPAPPAPATAAPRAKPASPRPVAGRPSPPPPPSAEAKVAAQAEAIAAACAKAGLPELAPELMRDGVSAADIEEAIHNALEIKRHVAMARKMLPAGALPDDAELAFIRAGASAQHVGRELLNMLVERQSPEILNAHQAGTRPAGAAAGAGSAQPDYGWDAIIKRVTEAGR